MKNRYIGVLTYFLVLMSVSLGIAQNVGINMTGAIPDSSAMLDIASSNKGLLIPRMDSISRKNIVTPAKGLMVFDSTYNSFYFYDGTAWGAIGSGGDNLGNHSASKNLQLNNHWLNNDGEADEGIYVDADGKVGILTTPDANFHVFMGEDTTTNVLTAIHSSGFGGDNTSNGSTWQSFTATVSGELSSVHLNHYQTANGINKTVNIYEGEGISGTLLYTGSATPSCGGFCWTQFPVSAVGNTTDPQFRIQAGQKYTIQVDNGLGWFITFPNPYSGGTTPNSNADYRFQAFVHTAKTGFQVTNDAVIINSYQLPVWDGTNGQVLATDGSGVVTWSDQVINTDNQQLTIDGNNLSLTDGGIPISLTPYLDNTDSQDLQLSGDSLILTNDATPVDLSSFAGGDDHLGNHTATQNVQLNGNWLNNDGGADKGLNIDNNGQVGINTTPAATFHVDMGPAQVTTPVSISHNGTNVAINFAWQSFTSPFSGPLDSISMFFDNTNGADVTYRLLAGQGVGGNILYENTITAVNGDNTFTFGGLTLQQNQVYTLSLDFATTFVTFYYDNTDSYTGGLCNASPTWDMDFTVYTSQGNAGFRVSNSGVTINEYSLPSNDGDANQVLTTNGAGNVTWASIATGSDNLGNHTTTQNLILGSNAIQNNASSANGLSLGSQNQLHVESDFQRSGWFTSTGVTVLGESLGNYIEVNNKAGTRSIFGTDGTGLNSPSDTLNTVIGNWTGGGSITFHVNGGTKSMTLDAFGRLGIGRIGVTNRLEVEGNASKSAAGSWLANSDARLKKNITSLSSDDMLKKILSLQGVTYEWNDNKTDTKRPEGIQYGFTAQNIQEVFPSLVTEDNNGFLQTPYGTYDAMTVEAIRALNDKMENMSRELADLKNEKSTLQSQVLQLQSKNQQLKANVDELSELKNDVAELKALMTNDNSSTSSSVIPSEK